MRRRRAQLAATGCVCFCAALVAAVLSNCNSVEEVDAMNAAAAIEPFVDLDLAREPLVAKLGSPEATGFERVREAFVARNPGYDVAWERGLRAHESVAPASIVFVQGGASMARLGKASAELRAGDLALLRANELLELEAPLDALLFRVPQALPPELPSFVRPDQDPRITDTPGGCAEEQDAYRRILLTWRADVGPYVFRALNAHRVRIFDSFTHYHPPHGGFDEFYLVQGVRPGAKLITSSKTARVVAPEDLAETELDTLLSEHELETGDLVYLPRGTIHRGFGGVLAQIITVPGFRPGAEIGVDHFLARANRRFPGHAPLPLHAPGADREIVK